MAPISIQKKEKIRLRLKEYGILENAIQESFSLGKGKGGQKKQKTANKVTLVHLPSNIQVSCERERERETNRWVARDYLCDHYQKKVLQQKTKAELLQENVLNKRKGVKEEG